MSEFSPLALCLILLVASLVAIVSRNFRLPYSVGLVAAGILLGLLPASFPLPLSRELIFTVFLPPLVFEAALHLPWRPFRRELPLTLLLALPGVALAAAVVAAAMHFLVGWSWAGAALFGVLIAATDPVSVIASFKELAVRPRLKLLVESESLLNDGAAAVGFTVLAAAAVGGGATPLGVTGNLLWTVFGGIAAGALVTGALLLVAWRTRDHLIEFTLTTVAAYGSFLLAERFGMSGVLASTTAGLMVGNLGNQKAISPESRGYVLAFWEYAAFLANSVVFILIGAHESDQPLGSYVGAAGIAIAAVLLGRAICVYGLAALVRPTRLRINLRYQHVLFWGGLRGALALALALALPPEIAERHEIVVAAFAVVAFSIFVQGLTMPWLIHRLRLAPSARPRQPPSR